MLDNFNLPPNVKAMRRTLARSHNRRVLLLLAAIVILFISLPALKLAKPYRPAAIIGLCLFGVIGIVYVIRLSKKHSIALGFVCPLCGGALYDGGDNRLGSQGVCPCCKLFIINKLNEDAANTQSTARHDYGDSSRPSHLMKKEEFITRQRTAKREALTIIVVWLVAVYAIAFGSVRLLKQIIHYNHALGVMVILCLFGALIGSNIVSTRFLKRRRQNLGLICPSCGVNLLLQAVAKAVISTGKCCQCGAPVIEQSPQSSTNVD